MKREDMALESNWMKDSRKRKQINSEITNTHTHSKYTCLVLLSSGVEC